jgi:membrane protein DedA with SNARE-associated domain
VLRINYRLYLVASAVGCLTWVPITAFGLYTLIWAWLEVAARSPATAVAAVAIGVGAVTGIAAWRRRSRRASLSS